MSTLALFVYWILDCVCGETLGYIWRETSAKKYRLLDHDKREAELLKHKMRAVSLTRLANSLYALVAELEARPNARQLLGLEQDASREAIRKTAHRLFLVVHPDRNGNQELFRLVVRLHDAAIAETKEETRPSEETNPETSGSSCEPNSVS